MPGHRPFRDLTKGFSPARKARVADKAAALDTALALHEAAVQTIGKVPCILVINKADLASIWEIDQATVTRMLQSGWHLMQTSAKSGEGVEEAFASLGRAMLDE